MTHTTSLTLSKELFEKGLKIETEKWWVDFEETDNYELCTNKEIVDNATYNEKYSESYPAPSTDELLAVLPENLKDEIRIEYITHSSQWTVCFRNDDSIKRIWNHTYLPEALGKMCEWLLDNGYHFNGKELRR